MSGQRHCARARCQDCGLHSALCVCSLRPSLRLPFSLLIVQHRREKHKPTNSVRPLRHLLPETQLIHYAVRGEAFDEAPLSRADRRYVLLFPEDSQAGQPAPAVQRLAPNDTLVVLDGTWAQCSRMRRRVLAFDGMPTLSLPNTGGSSWGIRHTLDPARVSTFEAVAGAARQSGCTEQAQSMLSYFQELAKRMQLMRGTATVGETSLSPRAYKRYIEEVNTPRPEARSHAYES